jgi:hypothetical protein
MNHFNYSNIKKSLLLSGIFALLALTVACDKDEAESALEPLPESVQIGDRLGGGVVFYIAPNRTFGLVAPATDQSEGIAWSIDRRIAFDSDSAVGSGAANTDRIIAEKTARGDQDVDYAAKFAKDLELGGYDDWYLPSIGELLLLHEQQDVVGGFTTGDRYHSLYWSSTNHDGQYPDGGYTGRVDFFTETLTLSRYEGGQSLLYRVRVIRTLTAKDIVTHH